MPRGKTRGGHNRRALAVEAARIMVDEHHRDFWRAKQKACERLGLSSKVELPTNAEIDEERRRRLVLFGGTEQIERVRHLREVALEAMRFLESFQPRLVGGVEDGTAGRHTPIALHLFADSPEDVHIFFRNQNLPFEEGERVIRLDRDRTQSFPTIRFAYGSDEIDLTILPLVARRHPPLDRIEGRPMRGIGQRKLSELLEEA